MNKTAYEHTVGLSLSLSEGMCKRADDNTYVFESIRSLNPRSIEQRNDPEDEVIGDELLKIRRDPELLRRAIVLDKSLNRHEPIWNTISEGSSAEDTYKRLSRASIGRRISELDNKYHAGPEKLLNMEGAGKWLSRGGVDDLNKVIKDENTMKEIQELHDKMEDLNSEMKPGFWNKFKNVAPSYAGFGTAGGIGGYFLAPKGWKTTGAVTGTALGLVANWLRRKHKYGDFITV